MKNVSVSAVNHEQTLKHDVDRLARFGDEESAKSLRSGITEMLWDMQKMELDAGVQQKLLAQGFPERA